MDILLRATEDYVYRQRLVNLRRGDEDFAFCSPRPTKTYLNERVFFMGKAGIVFGFATFEKYEYARVERNREGKPQDGMAIFFIGPFVPLSHFLPREIRPPRSWRYVQGEVANYL